MLYHMLCEDLVFSSKCNTKKNPEQLTVVECQRLIIMVLRMGRTPSVYHGHPAVCAPIV